MKNERIYVLKQKQTDKKSSMRERLLKGPKGRKCHLCGGHVQYNYYSGCYNYKIDKYVFCSWKCIQEYRRKHGLIPKDLA